MSSRRPPPHGETPQLGSSVAKIPQGPAFFACITTAMAMAGEAWPRPCITTTAGEARTSPLHVPHTSSGQDKNMPQFATRIATLGTENAFRIGEDIARCVARGMDVVRLNLGEPDFDTAPHINDAAIEQIRKGNSHYTDPQGILGLRTAVAEHVSRSRGIAADAARVVITTGGKPSIGFTMQAYVNPGDEVIYPSPGFPIYESWITYLGAIPVPLSLREETGFTFTANDLAARITPRTKVIILCSPSNPTGGVLSERDLARIAEVIRTRTGPDVRVYADEIYEHIVFDGAAHHSIAAQPGMASRTIVALGHSKGFAMTGWRLGWALLPSTEEAQLFKQFNIDSISCVPPFIQEAGRVALESPASQPIVEHMVSAFQSRRDWIVPALNDIDGAMSAAAGRVLCLPQCRRYVRAAWHPRCLSAPERPRAIAHITIPDAARVPARAVWCRHHGPELFRAHRVGRPALSASLDRSESRPAS